LKVVPFN